MVIPGLTPQDLLKGSHFTVVAAPVLRQVYDLPLYDMRNVFVRDRCLHASAKGRNGSRLEL